jgi:hypothetical protein
MPAPTIAEITIADEPHSWQRLGFAVSDGVCLLGSVRVRLAGAEAGTGIVGWSLRDLLDTELDGLPTSRSAAPVGVEEPVGAEEPVAVEAPEHPNGVLAIDHVVAMSPQLDRSVDALERAGLDLRRIREQPTPAGAPRQAFFRLGGEILEVVQEPQEALTRRGGTERPAHFWGLALLVADIERTVQALGEHCGQARDAVQPGRRIATLRRSAGLAVPVALMSVKQPVEAIA